MSGRFVRQSSFRHVFGDPAKKETHCFNDMQPKFAGDGDYIACNPEYFAILSAGGGGAVQVFDLEKPGRVGKSVPKITVHKSSVIDMDFNPFNNEMLATGAEDCAAKVTIFPSKEEGGITKGISKADVVLQGHQKKVHMVKFHPTAENTLLTGSYDNTVKVWDIEAQSESLSYNPISDGCTPCIASDWNTNGSLIASSWKDKQFRIFDPRATGAAITAPGFGGMKKSSIMWLDNHEKIAAVGFSKSSSRIIKIMDPKMMDKPLTEKEIDQSPGVFICHYDPDNSIIYLAGKGDASIKYWEVVPEAPYVHFLTEFRSSTSTKGCTFMPKRACDTTKCEIGRALRVLRDYVEPVSFVVPRKSDMFQEDLYPETYAGQSMQSHADYVGGKNVDPKMMSMKPGEGEAAVKKKFVAKKSPAELQAELDAANAKIAALEAEVAKLKA